MAGTTNARLRELGITLPTPPAPVASYVPFTVQDRTVYVSGQVPLSEEGLQFVGKVGADISVEEAQQAARLCALNILAHVQTACGGDLDNVKQCLKIGGFVNATPDFNQHPLVINGASDLLVDILGDRGKHARFAVGSGSLPANVSVEVDGLFELA